MLCCPYRTYHAHTKTRAHTHHFSLTTPLNKLLLTSEIAILVQGYSFSQQFHINSFSFLQTLPPGSLLPSTPLNHKQLFSTANFVSLPPSLTFRCHSSAASMPDCFDRPGISGEGDLIPPWSGALAVGSTLQPPGCRALSHRLKSHEGF